MIINNHWHYKYFSISINKILWDFTINTDKSVKANRPDIIVIEKNTKECLLIDVAVPADANVTIKEFDKKFKYKDLEIEIQRIWKKRTKVIPVAIGALGAISKDFTSYLNQIPADLKSHEIQKIALLGTAHILRKALMMS